MSTDDLAIVEKIESIEATFTARFSDDASFLGELVGEGVDVTPGEAIEYRDGFMAGVRLATRTLREAVEDENSSQESLLASAAFDVAAVEARTDNYKLAFADGIKNVQMAAAMAMLGAL